MAGGRDYGGALVDVEHYISTGSHGIRSRLAGDPDCRDVEVQGWIERRGAGLHDSRARFAPPIRPTRRTRS